MQAAITNSVTNTLTIAGNVTSNDQLINMWVFGKAGSTVSAYRRVASSFLRFVGKPVQWVVLPDLQAWCESLGDRIKATTKKTYISIIKSFLAFGHKIGVLQFNVGAVVASPKSKDTLSQRILTVDQVRAIIDGEASDRNRLILETLYYCGLRVSELAGLTWNDLNDGILTVFGKGGKTRSIRVPESLSAKLESLRGDAIAPIFQSRKGGTALDRKSLTRIVKGSGKRAGLGDKVSAHWLRHCHASHSLDNGAPISLVQTTLGHSSVATTSKYLHARPNQSSSLFL